jgi:hypothetical protein
MKLKKSSSLKLQSQSQPNFAEQFWPFEEISIFSNGGHLGYRKALTDTILKGDHPRIISARWPPSKFVAGDPDFQPRWPPS